MKYRHSFRVRAPVAQVAEFHRRSGGPGDAPPARKGAGAKRALNMAYHQRKGE
jgi:hypothetical protein